MFKRTSSIAIFKYLFLLFKHLNIYNYKLRYSNIYFYRAFSGKLAGLQVVLGFDELMMIVMSAMTMILMTFITMVIITLKPSVVIMMINNIRCST